MKKIILPFILWGAVNAIAEDLSSQPVFDYEQYLRENIQATFDFNKKEELLYVQLHNVSHQDFKNPGIVCYISVGESETSEQYDTFGFYVFKQNIPHGATINQRLSYLIRTAPESQKYGFEHIHVRYIQKASCYLANMYDVKDFTS